MLIFSIFELMFLSRSDNIFHCEYFLTVYLLERQCGREREDGGGRVLPTTVLLPSGCNVRMDRLKAGALQWSKCLDHLPLPPKTHSQDAGLPSGVARL